MSRKVPIAEQFYSIQGEGPYAGTPAVFLRLAGCNLSCGLTESDLSEFEKGQDPEEGADWICDTIDVWREASMKLDIPTLIDNWQMKGWLDAFQDDDVHLVLTGGEPTIPAHQKTLSELLRTLHDMGIDPFVEVETNGTIEPLNHFSYYIDQWNVSMKLENSGMSREDRISKDAITYYTAVHDIEDPIAPDAVFKFVIADHSSIEEILELQGEFSIPDSMIMLMPAGQTTEKLHGKYHSVAAVCKHMGWRFSPRLQVDIWGEVTGV